jgi:hypothetical protein
VLPKPSAASAAPAQEDLKKSKKRVDQDGFRARLGRVMTQMREHRNVSIKKAAVAIESDYTPVYRAEKGLTSSPRLVELYEEAFEDKVLIFLASDHPKDCAASTKKLASMERMISDLTRELEKVKLENGKLHGLLRRWKRILVHYNLFHLAMPAGGLNAVQRSAPAARGGGKPAPAPHRADGGFDNEGPGESLSDELASEPDADEG